MTDKTQADRLEDSEPIIVMMPDKTCIQDVNREDHSDPMKDPPLFTLCGTAFHFDLYSRNPGSASEATCIECFRLFMLTRRLTQQQAALQLAEEALKDYAELKAWDDFVKDSYSGQCWQFDWDGGIADYPWEIAAKALTAIQKLKTE